MPDTIISALAQTPFVLAMLYALLRVLSHMNRRDANWQEFIEGRDELFADRMTTIAQALDKLTGVILSHDARVAGAEFTREDKPVKRRSIR